MSAAHDSIAHFAAKWTNVGARLPVDGQMMFTPFQETTRIFADFDDQMHRVAAVSGMSGAAFTMLRSRRIYREQLSTRQR